jgi:phage tail-like protein
MRITGLIVALFALLLSTSAADAEKVSAVISIAGTQLSFESVSGLGSATDVIEVVDPNDPTQTTKRIGPTKWPNIVLKRGFAGDTTVPLQQLERAFADGRTPRGTATLAVYDRRGRVIGTWTLRNAWMSKWTLDASKSEISIETIEIAHEGIEFG